MPAVDPGARRGIQVAVDKHYRALNTENRELHRSTVDQSNPYYARVQREQFDLWTRSYGDSTAGARVRGIERLPAHYYRAEIALSVRFDSGQAGEALQSWVFRKRGGAWKLSEPRPRQLGPLRTRSGGGVTVEYYEWDEEQVARVLALSRRGLARASRVIGVEPPARVRVRLLPVYEVSPGLAAGQTVGYYRTATPDILFLRSPGSYGFGVYGRLESPYEELEQTAEHELTHLLADRRVPLRTLPMWMSEGLAEYVSDPSRSYLVQQAVRGDDLYSLYALQNFTLLSGNSGLAYGQSQELVAYVVRREGVAGYWRLARAYERTHHLDRAFRQALGVSQAQFERDWLRWLRVRYGAGDGP